MQAKREGRPKKSAIRRNDNERSGGGASQMARDISAAFAPAIPEGSHNREVSSSEPTCLFCGYWQRLHLHTRGVPNFIQLNWLRHLVSASIRMARISAQFWRPMASRGRHAGFGLEGSRAQWQIQIKSPNEEMYTLQLAASIGDSSPAFLVSWQLGSCPPWIPPSALAADRLGLLAAAS